MKTPGHRGQEVVGMTDIGPDTSNGKQAEAGRRQSHDGLEQRVGELEQQVADLSAKNAELVQGNKDLADAHRQLQAMLENVPDRIYFKDLQSRFLNLSRALAKRLGAADPKQVIGKTDFDFQLPERAREFYADEQRIMQTGEALINKTERQVLANGEIAWTSTTKAPLRDSEGKVVGLVGINRDITQQKQAEEALRQSYGELEQRVAERTAELSKERLLLRALIDNLPDCIYAKDVAGRKTLANPADLKNLRCQTEAEAIGKSDFDFFPKDIAEKFRADDQEVIAGQPVINREEYLFDEAGRKRWLLTSKLPLRDQDGKIVGLIGIGRNITLQKQAEEALWESQALYTSLVEQLPAGIFRKDPAGRYVLVNPWFCQLKGMKAEEFLGKTPDEAAGVEKVKYGDTRPEITRLRTEAIQHHERIMRTGERLESDEECLASDGQKRYLHVVKSPVFDPAGKIIGTQGVQFDVSERKKVEEALQESQALYFSLVEQLPVGVFRKDPAGCYILVNPWFCQLKGMKAEEFLGKTPREVAASEAAKHDPTAPAVDYAAAGGGHHEQIMQTGKSIELIEEYTHADGTKKFVQAMKLPICDLSGKIIGTQGILSDITEIKQAEEALRQSEEKLRLFATQLERSNRELQDFAYVASHDLQEPLRKIVVFGERLKEKNAEKFGPESVDYLDRMQKAARRMQTLINDLLTFSRVTTKARPFTPVNLAEVASGVVDDLEGRIELVKGRVEVGTLPVIEAEPLQMRQLLQNLIGNALKFRRPEESPVVKVEAQIIPDPDTPEKKLCRLTVSDNCIGFDEKYLDRIFNVFQRLHTRNEYEGTGMGLAIVKKIALYHGGDITAKSKPGEGSTFILTVPVVHPQKTQDEIKNKEDQTP
jgi:PAS domain S-box-containing protein